MSPTKLRTLVILAVVAGAVGWAAVELVSGQSGRVIPVPWLAGVTMCLLALGLAFWTLLARPRLMRRPGARPMAPIIAARSAALAMAASRTGALVGGFYAGTAIGALPMRGSEAGSAAIARGLVAVIGSVVLVVVALWLERLCRLPQDDDDDSRGTGAPSTARATRPGPEAVARADRLRP